MIENLTLTWITSLGGPLLVLPYNYLVHWHSDDDNPGNEVSDYDRMCAINDYIGLINVGGAQAIVLNDAPMPTAWIPSPDANGGTIARWECAEFEDHLVASLAFIPADLCYSNELILDIVDTPQVIFDSAYPGEEIEDSLTMELPIGRYSITTAVYQPDIDTSIILHRFVRNG